MGPYSGLGRARYSLIVTSGAGRISGPYDLGTPEKCPKAKKAKKQS